MVTVLLGGKFNKIHPGHEWLLKEAKKLGKLVVVLANDIRNNRPYAVKAKERKNNLEKLGIADIVCIGDMKKCSKVIDKYKPEIIVLGYDQKLPVDPEIVKGIKIIRMNQYGNYSTRTLISKDTKRAVEILKSGGVVAFPTETVYGLGALALNPKAIKKIYEIKQRPNDNPSIVHVADIKTAKKIAYVDDEAKKLMKKFWPGPLTLVLKNKIAPKEATAGLKNVAIRMPDNKIALELIRKAGPLVAPSANLSGRPSPTNAEHVLEDMNGKIELIVDGGPCKHGLESTVIDVKNKTLLRPGAITKEEIEKVIGKIKISQSKKAIAPGMKYKHYAPKAKVIISKDNIQELIDDFRKMKKRVGVISLHNHKSDESYKGKSEKDIARNLFKLFRDYDKKKIDVIIVESMEEKDLGLAIMNRARKATNA